MTIFSRCYCYITLSVYMLLIKVNDWSIHCHMVLYIKLYCNFQPLVNK